MRWVLKARSARPQPSRAVSALADHDRGSLRPEVRLYRGGDYPLDDKGNTYRNLILDKYPDLDIDFMHHAGNFSGVVDGSAAIRSGPPVRS